MKKNFSKYILAFILGCLFTCILFIPSFNMDCICTKYYGYDLTSLNFLGAGRLLTYVLYIFFAIIKLPFNILSLLSILIVILNITKFIQVNMFVSLILFMFGVNFVVLGYIGMFINKNYNESRNRPIYIAKEVISNEKNN